MGAVRIAFAKNLAYHRQRLGLTQAALAEMVDSTPSYMGHLERAEREPSLLTIEELATALKVQVGELFVTNDPDDQRRQLGQELEELLRGRSSDDIRLVIRLARAAFEDPRFSTEMGDAPKPKRSGKKSKRQPRETSRRSR